MLKAFLSHTRLAVLSIAWIVSGSVSPAANAGGNDTLGMALVGVGAMGAMVTVASVDSAAALADCSCKSSGGSCPMGVAGHCIMLPLSIASIIAGIVMMNSSSDTAEAVEGEEGESEVPESGGSGGGSGSIPPSLCTADTAGTYLCDPNGTEKMKKDLALVDDLNRQGLLGVEDPAKVATDIERAKRMINNMENGDYAAVLAESGAPVDEDSAGRGRASLSTGGFSTPGDDSDFGTGGHANYKGTLGLTATDGGGNGKVGSPNAKLGKVEWNGSLDMVDSETGKSLTIWERATRRYMGTPEGKRGFTMARIEFLRKQSTPKVSATARSPAGKKVAQNKEKPSSGIQPAQMSTSQVNSH